MARMQMFIFALLTISLVITGSMLFLADSTQSYGVTYDNSSITTYNKLNEINLLSQNFTNKTNDMDIGTDVTDIIGGYLTKAYSAVRITQSSYETFVDIGDQSLEDVKIDSTFLQIIKTFFYALILFAITFIIIKYFVKVDP